MKRLTIVLLLMLSACAHAGQNRYNWQDVGQAAVVEFGTVISLRPVEITGQNTGVGAVAGAGGGAIAGSMIGSGNGSLAGMLAGAVVAGVAGHMAEQAIADHQGIEYVITLESGKTVTIVQNYVEGDPSIKAGQRVMIQTSGIYQRVLPADNLPTEIKRPKKIKVKD